LIEISEEIEDVKEEEEEEKIDLNAETPLEIEEN
jgi:hypothetical protein